MPADPAPWQSQTIIMFVALRNELQIFGITQRRRTLVGVSSSSSSFIQNSARRYSTCRLYDCMLTMYRVAQNHGKPGKMFHSFQIYSVCSNHGERDLSILSWSGVSAVQISLNIGSVGILLQSLWERRNICPGSHTTYFQWFCETLYVATSERIWLRKFILTCKAFQKSRLVYSLRHYHYHFGNEK